MEDITRYNQYFFSPLTAGGQASLFDSFYLPTNQLFVAKVFNISSVLFQVIFNHEIQLKKDDNRINLLLLGIGGGNHEGPNLTDTIIFAISLIVKPSNYEK